MKKRFYLPKEIHEMVDGVFALQEETGRVNATKANKMGFGAAYRVMRDAGYFVKCTDTGRSNINFYYTLKPNLIRDIVKGRTWHMYYAGVKDGTRKLIDAAMKPKEPRAKAKSTELDGMSLNVLHKKIDILMRDVRELAEAVSDMKEDSHTPTVIRGNGREIPEYRNT